MQIINKYKNAQKHEKQTATPLGKNNELQILNRQHIKNEGVNIIASPHSKPSNLFSGSYMSVNCTFP